MICRKFIRQITATSIAILLSFVPAANIFAENVNAQNSEILYSKTLSSSEEVLSENIYEDERYDSYEKNYGGGLMRAAAEETETVSEIDNARGNTDKALKPGESRFFNENFDKIMNGKIPEGWELTEQSGSQLDIVNGMLHFNTRANEGTDGRRLLLPDLDVKDGSEIVYEADLRFAGVNDKLRWSGLMYAYKDESHWWQFIARKLSTAENGVELSRMSGTWTVMNRGWTRTDMPDDAMRHFKLVIEGGRATSYIDNILIGSVPYSGSTDGRLGITNRGVDLYVDNISVKITAGKPDSDYRAELYKPKTSIVSVPAVIAKSGTDAKETALAARRPSNIIIYPDSKLTVYSADGKLIANSLDEFYEKTASTVLPIIYLRNSSVADAVKDWTDRNSVMDISVMADYADAGLVRTVTSSSEGVRGIVRFEHNSVDADKNGKLSDKELWNIVYTTNFNFGEIAILDSELASRDNVAYMQRRLLTVWVESDGAKENICSAINTGADGIVSTEPLKVLDVLESPIYSSAPVVSRTMYLTGHRGQPSTNTENTLSGAIRATASGADAVECDIWLTEDGVLAINHDQNTGGLYNKWLKVENSSWNELSALSFKKPKNLKAGEGMARLDQYFQTFKNRDVVIFVELKTTKKVGVVTALRRLTQEFGMENQVVVISFDENLLSIVKREWQGIPTGLLEKISLNSDISNNLSSTASKNWRLGSVWQPNYRGGMENMRKLRNEATFRGMSVRTWTSKNIWQMDSQLFEGISGVTTDAAYLYGKYAVSLSQKDVAGGNVRFSPVLVSYDRNITASPQTELTVLSGNAPIKNRDGSYSPGPGITKAMLRYTQHTSSGSYYIYSNVFTIKQS